MSIEHGYPGLDERLDRVRRFWGGAGRALASLDTWEHGYRQVDDEDTMLAAAARHIRYVGGLPGCNLPWFGADFGTVSTARYWGGVVHRVTADGPIAIDAVAGTVEEGLALQPAEAGDERQDAARGVRAYRRLCERLETTRLWFRTPDMQGPLNTAGLVVEQEELLAGMYIEPEAVAAFLGRVTDHLISYQGWLRAELGGMICGNLWPYTFLPQEVGLSLTEDLMPLLSAETYEEFGIPYIRRLSEAFGPLHIHWCGEWGRHVPALLRSGIRICAVEFHDPCTTIEEVLPLAERGTVLVPMLLVNKQDRYADACSYYRDLLRRTGDGIRYWFTLFDEMPGALEFTREVMAAWGP